MRKSKNRAKKVRKRRVAKVIRTNKKVDPRKMEIIEERNRLRAMKSHPSSIVPMKNSVLATGDTPREKRLLLLLRLKFLISLRNFWNNQMRLLITSSRLRLTKRLKQSTSRSRN